MSNQTPNSHGAKHKGKNKNRQPKRQKIDTIDGSITSTQLTDVNTDCLERIFNHLNLDDLLNIVHASSCKQLKAAADVVFECKFRDRKFILNNPNRLLSDGSKDYIYIKSVRKSLRLIRCFGHLITKLAVGHPLYHKYLIPYVVDHCTDSLRIIEFVKGKQVFDYLEKPFMNVKIVNFNSCLNLDLERLNVYFPHMRRLTLDDFELSLSTKCIEHPYLEHLRINVNRNDVTPFLRSNSQLRSLRVYWGYNPEAFENATKCLQQLENLEVIYCDLKCLNSYKSIHLVNLKSLSVNLLDLYCRRNVWNPMHKLPFVCEKLQQLTLNVDNFRLSDELIDFIVKHPTITKLSIKSSYMGHTLNGRRMMKIARALPSLRDVDFGTFQISVNDALRFVEMCTFLLKFSFIAPKNYGIDELQTQLDQTWQITTNYYMANMSFVELEREI